MFYRPWDIQRIKVFQEAEVIGSAGFGHDVRDAVEKCISIRESLI